VLQGPRAQRSLGDSRQVLSACHHARAQIERRHWARLSEVQAQALQHRGIALVFSEEAGVSPLYHILSSANSYENLEQIHCGNIYPSMGVVDKRVIVCATGSGVSISTTIIVRP
jgi:hypothetical protein